jgi:hypothetical protein
MGLRSFGYDNPYAIEPFEPLQEKVGYKAVPLLVQLSSKAKSLRLLVRALRLSIPSHIQASSPFMITVLSSTTATLAFPTYRASDRLPNLWSHLHMD